jgi:methyl-accepting chemotaxis protein
MSRKAIGGVTLLVIGAAAAYWWYSRVKQDQSSVTAKSVTDTTKGDLSSTPLQTSKIAFAGLADPLNAIVQPVDRVINRIQSSLGINSAATDYRVRQGNPASAEAAFESPTNTNVSNYRPSLWAPITFNGGSV